MPKHVLVPKRRRTKRSSGRPNRTASDARTDILHAAITVFAERGIAGAGMREIARTANVDPALLYHYFDSKEDLFVSAVRLRLAPPPQHTIPPDETPESRAARLVRTFFERWGDGTKAEPFVALIGSTASSPRVARMVRELFTAELFPHVARRLGKDNADIPAGLIAAQLIGLGVIRNLLALEPLAKMSLDEFAKVAASGIATILRAQSRS